MQVLQEHVEAQEAPEQQLQESLFEREGQVQVQVHCVGYISVDWEGKEGREGEEEGGGGDCPVML